MFKRNLAMTMLLLLPLLQACSGSKKEEPVTLKFVFQSEDAFERSYGTEFVDEHPNIKLEIIPYDLFTDSPEKLTDIVRNQKPDVIAIDSLATYRKLSSEDKLMSLDTLIAKDTYDIDAFIPAVIDELRSAGGGSINGLTPYLSTQALYYNKKLFDRYGIPYPKDNMTMEQFLKLAERFPVDGTDEERVYGYFNYGQELLTTYFGGLIEPLARAANLSIIDPATDQVQIETEAWMQVFERGIKSFRSDAFRIEGGIENNLFAQGRAAMQIYNLSFLDHLTEYQAAHPNDSAVDWDFVTVPHNPDGPNLAQWKLTTIYSIGADSSQREAAWELVKYLNSEKIQRSAAAGTLVTRQALNVEREGRSVESLLNVQSTQVRNPWETLSKSYLMKFRQFANAAVLKVLNDNVPLKEALATLQNEAQAEWMKSKLDANKTASNEQAAAP
ncbi:ABC transporter substrate-binding protein [Paenibacillus sp. MMS18-CY102]|uniref:ABC transporter substrate-binding protein n=1 Tax=Paenibacillus sp. MMS18-CY102 TaxID=2682849 RepID=UPI0013661448|nr:extracellular solute-binding protein [Paenibacillus sp. MMS18-CY102]MWC31300.1 extracellular solute-binding protein [Paenibacillus sp. MMS18-CY102]